MVLRPHAPDFNNALLYFPASHNEYSLLHVSCIVNVWGLTSLTVDHLQWSKEKYHGVKCQQHYFKAARVCSVFERKKITLLYYFLLKSFLSPVHFKFCLHTNMFVSTSMTFVHSDKTKNILKLKISDVITITVSIERIMMKVHIPVPSRAIGNLWEL